MGLVRLRFAEPGLCRHLLLTATWTDEKTEAQRHEVILVPTAIAPVEPWEVSLYEPQMPHLGSGGKIHYLVGLLQALN